MKETIIATVGHPWAPRGLVILSCLFSALAGWMACSSGWTALPMLLGAMVGAVVATRTAYENGKYEEFEVRWREWWNERR